MSTPEPSTTLPLLHRYITTNSSTGTAVFHPTLPSIPPVRVLPDGLRVTFCYGTSHFPAQVADDRDLHDYADMIAQAPGVVIPGDTAFRIVNFPPGYQTPMHRTASVNFNVVVQGTVELILDSGETRTLTEEDSVVQRVVNHRRRNVSNDQWARLAAVPVPAEPLEVGGLMADEGELPGMRG